MMSARCVCWCATCDRHKHTHMYVYVYIYIYIYICIFVYFSFWFASVRMRANIAGSTLVKTRAAQPDPNCTRSAEKTRVRTHLVRNTTKHIPIVTSCLFHGCAQSDLLAIPFSWRRCWRLTSRVPRVLKTAPTASTRRSASLNTQICSWKFARCGRN